MLDMQFPDELFFIAFGIFFATDCAPLTTTTTVVSSDAFCLVLDSKTFASLSSQHRGLLKGLCHGIQEEYKLYICNRKFQKDIGHYTFKHGCKCTIFNVQYSFHLSVLPVMHP